MSKRSILPQNRHHIMIYDEDWDFLVNNYAEGIGAGSAAKLILHKYIRAVRAEIERKIDGGQPARVDEEPGL